MWAHKQTPYIMYVFKHYFLILNFEFHYDLFQQKLFSLRQYQNTDAL